MQYETEQESQIEQESQFEQKSRAELDIIHNEALSPKRSKGPPVHLHCCDEPTSIRSDEERGSDDTISENGGPITHYGDDQNDDTSICEESQFIDMEIDTQTSSVFDSTHIVGSIPQSTASKKVIEPPPSLNTGPFGIVCRINGSETSGFKYAPAPKKPNINLNRPPPDSTGPPQRPEKETQGTLGSAKNGLVHNEGDSLRTATINLPSRGGPAKRAPSFREPSVPASLVRVDGDIIRSGRSYVTQEKDSFRKSSSLEYQSNREKATSRELGADTPSKHTSQVHVNGDASSMTSEMSNGPDLLTRPQLMDPEIDQKHTNVALIGLDSMKSKNSKTCLAGRPVEYNSPGPPFNCEYEQGSKQIFSRKCFQHGQDASLHGVQSDGVTAMNFRKNSTSLSAPFSDISGPGIPKPSIGENGGRVADDVRIPRIETIANGALISANKPLSQKELQLHRIHVTRGVQGSQRSKETTNNLSGSKSKIITSGNGASEESSISNEPVNSLVVAGLMNTMLVADMEKLAKALKTIEEQRNKIRELKIANLAYHNDNAALQEHIQDTQLANIQKAGEDAKTERDKAQASRDKREKESLADWQNVLDQEKCRFVETVREMSTKMKDATTRSSEDVRRVMGEASRTVNDAKRNLTNQEAVTEIYTKDLDKTMLDLQHQIGVTEDLQNMLNEKRENHEELKRLILDNQQDVNMVSTIQHESQQKLLAKGGEIYQSVEKCASILRTINEREPKSLPVLRDLTAIIIKLSENMERRFQDAEQASADKQEVNTKAFEDLKEQVKMKKEDYDAQKTSNERLTSLREENAVLTERISSRDDDISKLNKQLRDLRQDLENCQSQVAKTNENLRDALTNLQEDLDIQNQLRDLQKTYLSALDQVDTSKKATESALTEASACKKSNTVLKEQVKELQRKIQFLDSQISAFNEEKKIYVEESQQASDQLRAQMERAVQARMKENESTQIGTVSSLRRQISDYETKCSQIQESLTKAQGVNAEEQDINRQLSAEIADLNMRTEQQSIELDRIVEEMTSSAAIGQSTREELETLREKVHRCQREAVGCQNRVQNNALLYNSKCREADEAVQHTKKSAELEIDRLQKILVDLKQKDRDSQAFRENVVCYLRHKGLLQIEHNLEESVLRILCERSPDPQLHSPDQQLSETEVLNNIDFSQQFGDKQAESVVLGEKVSVTTGSELKNGAAALSCSPITVNQARILPDDPVPTSRVSNTQALHLSSQGKRRDPSFQGSTSVAKIPSSPESVWLEIDRFPATEALPRSRQDNHGAKRTSLVRFADIGGSNSKKGTVIPDSQEVTAQKQLPSSTQTNRCVVQRRDSVAAPLHLRDDNLNVTRTDVTEVSVRTSKSYKGSPKVSRNMTSGILNELGNPHVTSGQASQEESRSPPSSPLSDLEDFSDPIERDESAKDLGWQPNPKQSKNIGRVSPVGSHSRSSGIRGRNTKNSAASPHAETMHTSKSILRRSISGILPFEKVADGQPTMNPPNPPERGKKQSGNTQRGGMARKTVSNDGLRGPFKAPYNRIVSGNKGADKNDGYQSKSSRSGIPSLASFDVFAVDTSPGMGQPQINPRKRSASGVGADDGLRSAKLRRPNQLRS